MLRSATVFCFLVLIAHAAAAHDSHGTYQVGAAIIATFEGHDGAAAEGWAFTVLDPDGAAWSRGMCDALGHAVFVPDRPGDWKVRVYAPDGHGGEVVVPVTAEFLAIGTGELAGGTADGACPVEPGRRSWITWLVAAVVAVAAAWAIKRRIQG